MIILGCLTCQEVQFLLQGNTTFLLRGIWNIFHSRESLIGFIQPAASGIQFLEGRNGAIHTCCSSIYSFKLRSLQASLGSSSGRLKVWITE